LVRVFPCQGPRLVTVFVFSAKNMYRRLGKRPTCRLHTKAPRKYIHQLDYREHLLSQTHSFGHI
jgi:hypothetical protein